MSDLTPLFCANCGAALDLPASGAPGVVCPVCQLFNSLDQAREEPALTRETLEARLGELLAQARSSGLAPDTIVGLLQDELEFAAELAHRGRDLCVQIVDLGPRAGEPVRRTGQGSAGLLRGRVVGG